MIISVKRPVSSQPAQGSPGQSRAAQGSPRQPRAARAATNQPAQGTPEHPIQTDKEKDRKTDRQEYK
jgi:hypothetical protein